MIVFWRRTDMHGLERAHIDHSGDAIRALSTVLSEEAGGLRCDYDWRIDPDGSTRRVSVTLHGTSRLRSLTVERSQLGWMIDGPHRPDLDGAQEPDLSVTPFCNTLPIHRLPAETGSELTLDTVYIDGRDPSVVRSRQRYIRVAQQIVRYVDLGAHAGFEASLLLDADNLVLRYEGLFERLHPSG